MYILYLFIIYTIKSRILFKKVQQIRNFLKVIVYYFILHSYRHFLMSVVIVYSCVMCC